MALQSFPTTVPSTGKPLTRPARPIVYGVKANTLIFQADSGFEQRRKKGATYKTFDLTYPIISLAEYIVIRDFFTAHLNVTAFYWTDPIEGETYVVRFDMDALSAQQKYHAHKGPYYELSLKLKEVPA